ncbi:hypothetical protein [Streptomyces sp. NPDC003554]
MLRGIDQFDGDLTIYSENGQPVGPSTLVAMIDEEVADRPEGMSYLLEVHLVRDVLRVWKSWRGGREPNAEEASAAVRFYATHDAYQPVE